MPSSLLASLSSWASSTTSTPSSTPEFPLFPLLPTEIRLKIWHYTFAPRHLDHGMLYDYYRPRPAPPSALHTNHESRTEALSIYTLLHQPGPSFARPWISPSLDTLQIPFHTFPGAPHFRQLAKEDAEFYMNVKNLGVWCGGYDMTLAYMTNHRLKSLNEKKEWRANDPLPIF